MRRNPHGRDIFTTKACQLLIIFVAFFTYGDSRPGLLRILITRHPYISSPMLFYVFLSKQFQKHDKILGFS